MAEELIMDEHKIPITELYSRLNTDPDKGLTAEQAKLALKRDGPNKLTKSKASKDMFKSLVSKDTVVTRKGEKLSLKTTDLVVGDIVDVKCGDIIPADLRIISAQGFKVDISCISGESEPQTRTPEFTSENPLETRNLAFLLTSVIEGTCRGVVVRTGDRTVMGKLAAFNI